jgi:hypothetical protein
VQNSRQLIDAGNHWEYGTSYPGGTEANNTFQSEVSLESATEALQIIDQAHATLYAGWNPRFTYDALRRRFLWAFFYDGQGNPNYPLRPAGDPTKQNFLCWQTFNIDTRLYGPLVIPPNTINQPAAEANGLAAVHVTDSGKIIFLYTQNPVDIWTQHLYAAIYDPATNAITQRAVQLSTDAPTGDGFSQTETVHLGSGHTGETCYVFYGFNVSLPPGAQPPFVTLSHRSVDSTGTPGPISNPPSGENTTGALGVLLNRIQLQRADSDCPSFRNVYTRGNTIFTSGLYGCRKDEGVTPTAAPALITGTPAAAPVWTIRPLLPQAPISSLAHHLYQGLTETVLVPALDPFPPAPQAVLFNSAPFGSAPFGFTAPPSYDMRDLLAWIYGPMVQAVMLAPDGTPSRAYSQLTFPFFRLWAVNDNRQARAWYFPQGPGLYVSGASAASNDEFYVPLNAPVPQQGFTGSPQPYAGVNPAST